MIKGIQIRWMVHSDLPQVLDIERCSQPESWTPESFLETLRHKNVIWRVAEQGFLVHGFIVYSCESGLIQIVSVGVAPDIRRNGIGRALVEQVRGAQKRTRRRMIEALVPEGNLRAQQFFRAVGFQAERIVASGFDDGQDLYLMRARSDEELEAAPLVNRLAKTNQGKG